MQNRLRERRRKLGLTLDEIADMLAVNASTVSRWESGIMSPRLDEVPRICQVYKAKFTKLWEVE